MKLIYLIGNMHNYNCLKITSQIRRYVTSTRTGDYLTRIDQKLCYSFNYLVRFRAPGRTHSHKTFPRPDLHFLGKEVFNHYPSTFNTITNFQSDAFFRNWIGIGTENRVLMRPLFLFWEYFIGERPDLSTIILLYELFIKNCTDCHCSFVSLFVYCM